MSYGHTFATLALQNGVDIKTVSSMLGHYDAGFTLRTYTHATRQKQDEAAQKMGGLLAQAREETTSKSTGRTSKASVRCFLTLSAHFAVWVRVWVLALKTRLIKVRYFGLCYSKSSA